MHRACFEDQKGISSAMVTLTQWVLVTVSVLTGALAGILLKLGAGELRGELGPLALALTGLSNWKVLAAGVLYLSSMLIWLQLLRQMDLSLLQPLLALGFVATPLLAMALLGEQISLSRAIGIAVVLVGVVIVSRN